MGVFRLILVFTQDVQPCDFLSLAVAPSGARDGQTSSSDDSKRPLSGSHCHQNPANLPEKTCDDLEETENTVKCKDSTPAKLEVSSRPKLTCLPGESFDVVIFCYLLEYLPTPELRLKCCSKAYQLLRKEGLLVIVTPDSKHVCSNAFLYKCWQASLASLGFARVKYEKQQHFHGMVFRKGNHKHLWQQEAHKLIQDLRDKRAKQSTATNAPKITTKKEKFSNFNLDEIHNGLLIPQDFQETSELNQKSEANITENKRKIYSPKSENICSKNLESKRPKCDS